MLLGLLYLFIGWLILMGIGYGTIRLFRFVFGFPNRVKQGVKNAVDNTIDRAFERNPQQTIVEEHNTYNDIKILNQK
ncbi:hypothetical protein R8G61_02780 [Tenacibaculum maritimum]